MADTPIPADLDITTDLNSQSPDAVPYHGGDVPQNRQPPPAAPEVPEASEGARPRSLRDTLTDAFKGEVAPPAVAPAEAPQAPSEGPELVKVGDRFHRRDGSFASNDEIAAFTAVASGQPAPPVLAPWAANMTAVEREQFASLPAETRQFVERTMEGVNQRGSQYQEYGLIEQIIGPRRQEWAGSGVTAPVAINQLLALSDYANSKPGEFVLWFADQNKIDLDKLLDDRDAAAGATEADPRYDGLQREIVELRNTITGFTNVTVEQRQAQNFQRVTQFMEEKDADGNLLHPYFNDVADGIAQHVQLIRAQQPYLPEADLLKAAYDFATFNSPAIREKMQQQALKDAQDRAAAEAIRARAAGVSINGGPAGDSSGSPNNASRTLREELQHAYHQSTLQ